VTQAQAGADGSFSARWRTDAVGRVTLRAVVPGDAGVQVASAPATVQVTVYRPARATWYGPGLFGRRTACGQRLTRSLVGVAHKRLPCGTPVRGLYGGRTITAPGGRSRPFVHGASYDLTSRRGPTGSASSARARSASRRAGGTSARASTPAPAARHAHRRRRAGSGLAGGMAPASPPLSIDEARARVLAAVRPLRTEDVPSRRRSGGCWPRTSPRPHDVPGFANSAMDGFAVRSGPAGRRLRLVGESRAGAPADAEVERRRGRCGISTGALLPAGADAVLQLELAREEGGTVTLGDDVERRAQRALPRRGPRGRRGRAARGHPAGPAAVGVAVAAGRARVRCARRPAVAIVTTGDELTAPGTPWARERCTTRTPDHRRAGHAGRGAGRADRPLARHAAATRAALAGALEAADLVVASGGVSVGPHDHVKHALRDLGVEEAFWRVALRPGRPTWFGTRGDTAVFGPAGATPFRRWSRSSSSHGRRSPRCRAPRPSPGRGRARLAVAVERHPRPRRVRPRADRGRCRRTHRPAGLHVLTSMLGADALAIVTRAEGEVPAGGEVEVEAL
jgi:molybdopterin molybdotransferase